jgi:hypothetical protein
VVATVVVVVVLLGAAAVTVVGVLVGFEERACDCFPKGGLVFAAPEDGVVVEPAFTAGIFTKTNACTHSLQC